VPRFAAVMAASRSRATASLSHTADPAVPGG
jgi:hypothetical protein